MIRNHLYVALISMSILLSCAAPTPHDSSPLQQLHALSDPGFNGGLNQQEMALSQSLAQIIGRDLPEVGLPCRKPNDPPPDDQDGQDEVAGQGIGAKTPALLELADIIQHGSMPQQAVALHAIALMGMRARAVRASFPDDAFASAWGAEALHALTCGYYGEDLAKTMPSDKLPPDGVNPHCSEARGEWVLDTLADRSRYWPKRFLEGIWFDTQQSCQGWGQDAKPIPVQITPERQARLNAMLADGNADLEARKSLLYILSEIGPPAVGMAQTAMPLAHGQDEELSRAARQYIFSLGIPESVEMLRYSVEHNDWVSWTRGVEIPRLRPFAHEAVPVFANILQDPRTSFISRTDAAESLGELQSPEAIPALLAAISSRDWPTTSAAIESLAPYASTYPEVQMALKEVSRSYWSGLIRDEATTALKKGHVELGCGYRTDGSGPANPDQVGCIELIGVYTNDHKMPKCKDGKLHSGRYRTSAGKTLQIQWREPVRQLPPHGPIEAISSWCQMVGTVEALPVKNGWLVGCMGFEASGALKFLSQDTSKKPARIDFGATRILVQASEHIYAAGPGLFEMGAEAGGLDEVIKDSTGVWKAHSIAALPSSPSAVAVFGKAIAFKDALNAVLYDPDEGILALTCED